MTAFRCNSFGAAFCLIAAMGCLQPVTPRRVAADASPAITTNDQSAAAAIRIELTDARPPAVVVRGLSAQSLSRLADRPKNAAWQDVFAMYVGREPAADRPAVLGDYEVEGESLVFRPRYPLVPGLDYHAVFRPAEIDGAGGTKRSVTQILSIPKPVAPPTTVTHVYPSRDVLPENQLKFYLHFSAPMSRGEAYRHIHLVEQAAGEVEYPFLELGEELWDDTGRRFTLFIDPGRIKRGLKPREDVGPSLEAGKSYRLVINRPWRDAAGNPLAEPFEKSFRVGPPDVAQPESGAWQLTIPAAGTTEPLAVAFGEPLDHAMLGRVIAVTTADAVPVQGAIAIEDQESVWRFQPAAAWPAGDYRLVVDTALEDLAGNSIARPFEVDVVRPIHRQSETATVTVPFRVAEPGSDSD